MILAISTSSPMASAALFRVSGELIASEARLAPQAAGEAILSILRTWDLTGLTGIAADIGPGSFTGVRVGVTMAKTLAFRRQLPCFGILSVDLIAPDRLVAVPSKKGEWFVRMPGSAITREATVPEGAIGFRLGSEDVFPLASRAGTLLVQSEPMTAAALMPFYGAEPSISTPKKPLIAVESRP